MGRIRELPPSVVNQIAAGEVVERPASVVKELLENAIDAGAARIEVVVERGGKDLIRVADDGRGIDPEDLPLAFRPHATSKLSTVEDLHRVRTLGFRGEALAAIAEVARVRCQSRPGEAATGHEIRIEAGVAGPVQQAGIPPGTVVEVRNLFFNTPVRRAYLKSDTTEAGHALEMFQRIALAFPGVHLSYRSGGKIVYDLPPAAGLKDRVAVFFGQELADHLLWVESRVDGVGLRGYVAHPSQSRSSPRGQYLFLGGRFVRDRSLSHALSEAYRGLLMVGRLPVAFLHLEIPPEDVDVNVHPMKVEVRFRDGQRIYSQLLATVRRTFLESDLHTRLQIPRPPETPGADGSSDSDPNLETLGERERERERGAAVPGGTPDRSWATSKTAWDPDSAFALSAESADRQMVASWFAPGGGGGASPSASFVEPSRPAAVPMPPPPSIPADQFDEFAGESPAAAASAGEPSAEVRPASSDRSEPPRAMQLHDSYLVVETPEGMVVIDQHALHERILFEELRARVRRAGLESQRLLLGEPVEVSREQAAALREHQATLTSLGLGFEASEEGTVLLTQVPAILPDLAPERLVRDLADALLTRPVAPSPDQVLQDLLSLMACKAAVKAGQRLTPEEIAALLARRDLVLDAHHCPHGRPTALTLTKSDLERQFGRI